MLNDRSIQCAWRNSVTRSVNYATGLPRVFISYAWADGRDFANALRLRLEAEGISVWQDLIGMEGGHDWWLQIIEALDQVEFMVLVMTPGAMQSPTVCKEWRYARQEGVCVYPVKASPFLISPAYHVGCVMPISTTWIISGASSSMT